MGSDLEITPEMLEQNPQLMGLMAILGLIVLGVGSLSLTSLGFLTFRHFTGHSVLKPGPWLPRQWSLLDLLLTVVAVFFGQILFSLPAMLLTGYRPGQAGDGQQLALDFTMIVGFGNIAAAFLICALIGFRYGVGASHVGVGTQGLGKLLGTGVLYGFAALGIVYPVMILTGLLSKVEYEHPLIKAMSEEGSVWTYIYGCVSAVLIAPLVEEFGFRVLLQGWLQSLPFKSAFDNIIGRLPGDGGQLAGEAQGVVVDDEALEVNTTDRAGLGPSHSQSADGEQIVSNPYATVEVVEAIVVGDEASIEQVPPLWPCFVAGLLFGLAHFDYGVSWIPLSVFGFLLGLVYRATHSLWPCVVMHMMLNGLAMTNLGLLLLIKSMV